MRPVSASNTPALLRPNGMKWCQRFCLQAWLNELFVSKVFSQDGEWIHSLLPLPRGGTAVPR
jgi:hypothetical protein